MSEAEARAWTRFLAAFTGPPVLSQWLTDAEIAAVNRFHSQQAPFLDAQRRRVEQRTALRMAEVIRQARTRVYRRMQSMGAFPAVVQELDRLLRSVRTPAMTSTQIVRAAGAEVKEQGGLQAPLMRTVRGWLQQAMLAENVDIGQQMFQIIVEHWILCIEIAGRAVQEQVLQVPHEQSLAMFLRLSAADEMEDTALISIVYREETRVLEFIDTRTNHITSVQLSDAMWTEIQEAMMDSFDGTGYGALGAEDLAREIGKRMEAQMAGPLPSEVSDRLMLWARTEGAVVMNDALMKIGREAGMDGKIWQSVGDAHVRDAHAENEAAGVIHMDDSFPDGSFDAGSGSESPFNCRCTCGPAIYREIDDKRQSEEIL